MIIKKMTASFGCLENAEMELHEGLNIISAPNESGKSTWCAFIRAMLYGIDSSQREKGGVKPDKVKYAPWSGAAMGGEMEISHEGKDITLRRSTKSAAAPMREFSAVYTGTADSVPGLKGTDAGLVLTGMPKAVFESSVFVRQSGLAVSNSAELEKRINAIISTGDDEALSFTDADAALRAWLRKRRHNRSGALPVLEGEINEKRDAIDAAADAAQRRAELESRLERSIENEKQAEESARHQLDEAHNQLINKIELLRNDLSELEKTHAAAAEKSKQLKAATETGPFAGRTPEEAMRVATVDSERLANFIAMVPGATGSIVALLLGLAAIAVGYLLSLPIILAISFVLIMGSVVSFAMIKANKNRVKNFSLNLADAYQLEDVSSEAIVEKAEAYVAACTAANEAGEELAKAESELAQAREELRAAEETLLTSGGSIADSELLALAKAETAQLRHNIALIEGKLAAMGDPMVMGTELQELMARHDELTEQYEALSLAIDILREANDEMQQRFSPALGRRAGEIMAKLTGGKYASLSFSRELDATAKRSEDSIAHEKAFLSEGTADQLYLALRLAICELALPEDCSCPIILDDALVNFDSERMGYAMELLQEIAEQRQVILFTCHEREAEYLKNK